MKKIINPYLAIVNKKISYNPKIFKGFEYEVVPVTAGDRGKTTASIEKQTKLAFDNAVEEFTSLDIKCLLMSAKRDYLDQAYAQAEMFASNLNSRVKEQIEKEENQNEEVKFDRTKKIKTILKHPKFVKLAYQHQRKFAARIGHSEHHTGLAIDISVDMKNAKIPDKIREKYPDASQGLLNFLTRRLIMEKHGFILTYPQSDRIKSATGMVKDEGWHWRYVTPEHSQRIAKIREKVTQILGEKQEVFLEDYVKLLSCNVNIENEQALVEEYSKLFITQILKRELDHNCKL